MKWEWRKNGCTGCSEWWEGYSRDGSGGRMVEVMFCTKAMHVDRPDIPEGWVYFDISDGYEWESFPDSCTTPEECMAYIDVLVRMQGEL